MYRQKRILAFLLAVLVAFAPITNVYASNSEINSEGQVSEELTTTVK